MFKVSKILKISPFLEKKYFLYRNILSNEIVNVNKLDLSGLNLKCIPTEIFKCRNLKILFLYCNKIKNIPYEINNLNLNSLILHKNKIKNICLSNTSDLKILDLSNNKFTKFPIDLLYLQLQFLDLSDNHIDYIPKFLNDLTDYRYKNLKLYIHNNPCTNV